MKSLVDVNGDYLGELCADGIIVPKEKMITLQGQDSNTIEEFTENTGYVFGEGLDYRGVVINGEFEPRENRIIRDEK